MIIAPTRIVPDTSTLNGLADDLTGADADRRRRAQRFLAEAVERGWVFVISFEHLIEMCQHANDTVIERRLQVLDQLPVVATPSPVRVDVPIGSTVDVLTREVRAAYLRRCSSLRAVRDAAQDDLLRCVEGRELFAFAHEVVPLVSAIARTQIQWNRILASMTRFRPLGCERSRIPEEEPVAIRNPPAVSHYLQELNDRLIRTLHEEGAQGIEGIEGFAEDFVSDVASDLARALELGGVDIGTICEATGFDRELVQPGMTVDDIGYLAGWNHRLKVVSRNLQLPGVLTAKDVAPDPMPSQRVDRAVTRVRTRGARRAEGGDLMDDHLLSLGCYADVAVVDKRTKEWCRQAKQADSELNGVLPKLVKLPRYVELLNAL